MSGKLYVVGTPIGNLGDFSPRALETLQNCSFIAAEDTRVTLKLLNRFEIKKPLKKNIQFKNQNLMEPENIRKKYDLILCRNVMIYFDTDSKKTVIKRLESSLKPGGYLIVGLAEVLPREFTTLEFKGAAVYRKPE